MNNANSNYLRNRRSTAIKNCDCYKYKDYAATSCCAKCGIVLHRRCISWSDLFAILENDIAAHQWIFISRICENCKPSYKKTEKLISKALEGHLHDA